MKLLPLNKGRFTQVDDDVFEWAQHMKWFLGGQCKRSTTITGQLGYPTTKLKDGHFVKLTRFIMPHKQGFVVDHINRDTLDNRRVNLRYIIHSENLANSNVRADSTTGFKGVSPHSRRPGVFTAYAFMGGRRRFIGNYKSPQEAASARVDYISKMTDHPELLPPPGGRKGKATGFRCVSRSGDKWAARVMVKGKSYWLGRYVTPEEAAKVAEDFRACLYARL